MRDSAPVPPSHPRQALHRDLQRAPDDIIRRFKSLNTGADVADLLELPWSQLHYVTSRRADRYPYRTFAIPKKSGGVREIQAPSSTVLILQRKLHEVLKLVYQPHPSAHGFVGGRSILTNAARHEGARTILNLDLEEFFPTIEFQRVRGVFIRRFDLPENVATILARLCCNTGDSPDHLPQGAPTSPIISNMICHSMDRRLTRLAKKYGLFYTRYADDLTFSTRRRSFPAQVAHVVDGNLLAVGPELDEIVTACGFALNDDKSRASTRASRLTVTGLTVNEFVNVRREYVRSIRGVLNAWREYGTERTQERYLSSFDPYHQCADFRAVLSGHLAFLRSVRGIDDRLYRRLYDAARALDGDCFPDLPPLSPRAESLLEAARDFPAINPTDSRELRQQYLRRMVASARGVLWLVDPGLTVGVVEQVAKAAEALRASEVRLLSDDRAKARHAERFNRWCSALEARGISVEWRILAPRRQFHDRWIGDDSDWIAIGGPIAAIDDPTPAYSQNHATLRPPHLDRWWSEAKPVRGGNAPDAGVAD